jgi:hypothetical protein
MGCYGMTQLRGAPPLEAGIEVPPSYAFTKRRFAFVIYRAVGPSTMDLQLSDSCIKGDLVRGRASHHE